jgi:hypothetical protein
MHSDQRPFVSLDSLMALRDDALARFALFLNVSDTRTRDGRPPLGKNRTVTFVVTFPTRRNLRAAPFDSLMATRYEPASAVERERLRTPFPEARIEPAAGTLTLIRVDAPRTAFGLATRTWADRFDGRFGTRFCGPTKSCDPDGPGSGRSGAYGR